MDVNTVTSSDAKIGCVTIYMRVVTDFGHVRMAEMKPIAVEQNVL